MNANHLFVLALAAMLLGGLLIDRGHEEWGAVALLGGLGAGGMGERARRRARRSRP